MDQSVNIPWAAGMNYGMGVNLLTGDIAGKAVEPGEITAPTKAEGQTVSYDLIQINSMEELYSSLDMSIEASGRYGLFNASAKAKYANQSKFNSQATFLLARCVVMNAFTQVEDARIRDEAASILSQGQAFHNRYGDGYVRGMQTGGEFFITISITSSTKEEQQSIAANLKATYGTKFGPRGEGEASLNQEMQSKMSRSELRVSTYQRGGKGVDQSLVETVEAAMERLKAFPAQIVEDPVPYEVQVASYHTLPLPEGQNPTDIEKKKELLEQYAKLQLKFISLRNEVEFIQSHPEFFDELPKPLSTLSQWIEELTGIISNLKRDSAKCANDKQDASEIDSPDTQIESYEEKLTEFNDDVSTINRRSVFQLINGREKNASITVENINFPTDLPGQSWKHSVVYKNFEATVKLTTLFLESKINSGRGIGLGIFSRAANKTIAINYRIVSGGTMIGVLTSGGGAYPEDFAGGSSISCEPSDVVYFRIRKEGNTFEMFHSFNGLAWTRSRKGTFTDSEYAFGSDDPLDVVFTGYTADGVAITGKFYNLNIEKIAN